MIKYIILRNLNSFDKIPTIQPNLLLVNVFGINNIEEFKFSYETDRFVSSLVSYVMEMQCLKPDNSLIFTQELKKLTIVVNRGSVDLTTLIQLNLKLYKLISLFISEFNENVAQDDDELEKMKVNAANLYFEALAFILISFEIIEFLTFVWLLKYFAQNYTSKSLSVIQTELHNLMDWLFHFNDRLSAKKIDLASYVITDEYFSKIHEFMNFVDVKVFKLISVVNSFIKRYNKTEANFEFYKLATTKLQKIKQKG